MKKISVIIPCYNAVNCIDRCLESLTGQTIGLESMEIILVNDASTDATFQKLCAWEQRYPDSVAVINCAENGKQGQARNIGMQYASGEYIAFVDDDDILEAEMYEMLFHAAKEHHCDLAIGQSVRHTGEEAFHIPVREKRENIIAITTEEERRAFLRQDINIAIWNKIYRRDFLEKNRICFLPGVIYDDIYFSALVKQYCTRVYLTNQVYYHHIISKSSASGVRSKTDRIGFMEVHIALIEELRVRGIYEAFADWYEKEFFIDYLSFMVNYQKTFGQMEPELKQIIRQSVTELFPEYHKIPVVQKILTGENPVYRNILQDLEEL